MVDNNTPPYSMDPSRLYPLLTGRMPLAAIVWGADLRVQDWNPAAEKIFGWPPEEARGRHARDLMLKGPGSSHDFLEAALSRGDETEPHVCAALSRAGKQLLCEWHNTPLRDPAGNTVGLLSLVHDRTACHETEQEMRSSAKLLQAIIESEPECVKLLNADGTVIMMNRAGIEMLEADSAEQVKGQCVCPMVVEEYRDAFRDLTAKVFAGGSGSLIFEMSGLKGRKLWLETHAVPLRDDNEQIVALLGITRDITAKRRTEENLRKERDFSAAVLDTVASIVLVLDRSGRIVRFNRACEEVSGYMAHEVTGKFIWDLLIPPEQMAGVKQVFSNLVAGMFPNKHENYWVAKDGTRRLIAWSNTALLEPDGSVEFVIPTGIDITEHRKLEEQLRHSQKMESLGTLAGGIAHDFNNILTAVIGYGSLLRMKMKEDEPLRHNVEQILISANRAASLTRGLLAYSRKQVLNAQPVDLNSIIKKVELLLKRLIGEDIELKTLLTGRDVMVMADAGQIEQVLMNLATNARDAMPRGGCLFIETDLIVLDEKSAKVHEFGTAGTFAQVTVTDSGTGIDKETQKRIFDPFFTTKEVGKGTGLGLSTAYGIVKQHGGTINVYSEAGNGTTFKIYLPAVAAEAVDVPHVEVPSITGGSETILVAEDEELVRKLTSSVLEQFGYRVIEAVDGEDAVRQFMENKDRIDLLLLDVIMPKKNGREALSKIRIFRPDVKALFLSGYTADIMQQKGLLDSGVSFIMKPVPVNELLRRVRSVLDS